MHRALANHANSNDIQAKLAVMGNSRRKGEMAVLLDWCMHMLLRDGRLSACMSCAPSVQEQSDKDQLLLQLGFLLLAVGTVKTGLKMLAVPSPSMEQLARTIYAHMVTHV